MDIVEGPGKFCLSVRTDPSRVHEYNPLGLVVYDPATGAELENCRGIEISSPFPDGVTMATIEILIIGEKPLG